MSSKLFASVEDGLGSSGWGETLRWPSNSP